MSRLIDLAGRRFNKFTILRRADNTATGQARWFCRCDCGEERIVVGSALLQGHSKSCGCNLREMMSQRAGDKHPGWKGGKKKTSKGYIEVLVAPGTDKYVGEHILVMEAHIGRKLFPDETVHHMNGIRSDNRLENLELWVSNHPSGQRVSDIVKWARQILERYDSDHR